MPLTARPATLNGKKGWCVNLSAGLIGTRQRVLRYTKKEAEEAAEKILSEKRSFESEGGEITLQERALILRSAGNWMKGSSMRRSIRPSH